MNKKENTKTKIISPNNENKLLSFIVSTLISIIITYFTVSWAFYKQKNEGKYLAFEIVSLYTYNWVNKQIYSDPTKSDIPAQTKESYVRMLKHIEDQLNSLNANPYYVYLIKKYPEFSQLKLLTSYEISNLDRIEKLETKVLCHKQYLELYYKLKKDLPQRFFKERGKYYKLDKDVDILKNMLNVELKKNNIPIIE